MKKLFFSILPVMLVAALLMTSAYAAGPDGAVPYAAGAYQSEDVPIGSSNEVLMVGTVEPTIMSVNKVISPRITVTNNSSVPVSLDVIYTSVDLSKLQGTTWNNGQYVGENQIAIGFQLETLTNQMPTSFDGTKWLWANTQQDLNVMSLGAYDNSTMYVVGTLGSGVPENNTFSVIPTFIVRQA